MQFAAFHHVNAIGLTCMTLDRPHNNRTPLPKRPSKYRNTATLFDGIRYSSKAEAKRAAELAMMAARGGVRCVLRQPRFTLGVPENVYVADFLVVYADGRAEVEDVKGMRTRKFAHDLTLWKAYGRLPLAVLTWKRGKWCVETYAGGLDPVAASDRPRAKESAGVFDDANLFGDGLEQ